MTLLLFWSSASFWYSSLAFLYFWECLFQVLPSWHSALRFSFLWPLEVECCITISHDHHLSWPNLVKEMFMSVGESSIWNFFQKMIVHKFNCDFTWVLLTRSMFSTVMWYLWAKGFKMCHYYVPINNTLTLIWGSFIWFCSHWCTIWLWKNISNKLSIMGLIP